MNQPGRVVDQRGAHWTFVLGALAEYALAGLALGLAWLFGMDLLTEPERPWRVLAIGVLATLPLAAFAFGALRVRSGPLASVREDVLAGLAKPLRQWSVLELTILAMSAGLGEELLFRGFLQTALTGPLGPLAALLLTSLIFGLLHPISRTYVVLATLFGLYFGALALATGSLLAPVISHTLYDLIALLLLKSIAIRDHSQSFEVPDPPPPETWEPPHPPGGNGQLG